MSLTKASYAMINGAAVNTKDFGAVGDGVTDDTAAVQAAIDYCLSTTTPLVNGQSLIPQLHVSGMCKITAPLTIDRPSNQTGFFRIIGDGVVGGFVVTTATSIFSTTSAFYATQLSNQVSFENLTFQGVDDGGTILCYAIQVHRYVRTQIKGCFFNYIRLNDGSASTAYVQSLYITDTFVRSCPGKWFNCYSYLDVHVDQSLFEAIKGQVFYCGGNMNVFTLRDSVLEGNFNDVVDASFMNGVVIDGNYIEDNDGHFVNCGSSTGALTVSNNNIGTKGASDAGPGNRGNSNWYEIIVSGDCESLMGFGNTGLRLYGLSGTIRTATIGFGDIVKTISIYDAPAQLCNDITLVNQTMFGNVTFPNPITFGTVTIRSGSGSPEGVITAPVGSLYTNTAGSTSTTLYVKTSGSGNTGWTAK